MTNSNPCRHAGFTLVELIVVMIIIGIMSVTVLPRMDGLSAFDSRGFRDQTVATLRFAQKTAIAQRRAVCVTIASTGITLRIASLATAASCGTGTVLNPPFAARSGSGLAGSGFIFLRQGETDGTGAVSGTITLAIAGADSILIDSTTGYVR